MNKRTKNFFTRGKKYIDLTPAPSDRIQAPKQQDTVCPKCQHRFGSPERSGWQVCTICGYHNRLGAEQRLALIADEGSWEELGGQINSCNFLDFPDYSEKLKQAREVTGLNEAIITGKARLMGIPIILAIMDHRFMGGSMGVAVGEKVVQAVEHAVEARLPLLVFSASGGARMQEGMAALMQMARTADAVQRIHDEGLLYICVMTDPTTGGVSASFAALADIIVAEPGALIGFTGPRVIRQTIKQPLPEGFQRAEYLLEHGMIDAVVPRKELRHYLAAILRLHLTEKQLQEEE
jgi:acetyl-CoA carboxylase carboxyl transferase subunit beta